MRVLQLTPGTGSFHCGSCLRDNALIKALRARGHDALLLPLYLPLVTDADEANPEQAVRVGGVGLYLQHKFSFFHKLPKFVHRWVNSESILRWASTKLGMTSARDLGEMTVGSLEGEKGKQWPVWNELVDWICESANADVICLSNALLIGLAPAIARRTGKPIVCALQGEDAFVDTLIEPYRSQAWALLQENAKYVTKFISPSKFYAEVMSKKLAVGPEAMAVVPNGINFETFLPIRSTQEPPSPTIGYLARMIHGKGLTTLVDAFILLAKKKSVPGARLRIAGTKTEADDKYIAELQKKIRAAGFENRVTWEPNLSFEHKVQFLHELSVLSVPATYGEAFGLYIAEAQGVGVPVVQPRHGAFPEILEVTQGGVICDPDDPQALATALEELLKDDARRHQMAATAKVNARAHFSSAKMAENFEKVLQEVATSAAKVAQPV
ncbi:glycosyltransferase family 4 protein [Roseimicrobium sp. ORNL1]|uniref:glycosyltransferase family 4 protein n=1 Tax=Roseimicrobium sp. ORNL1 TaxID=2711231 RepID=UPI0013E1BF56|nr:glycosyltransferase family 4 protein [Roseimicrobium sp. ORNL1]QIF02993.1 glycosyltransferase family 4 protein [Roseimicrobium sp. ORNL1]